MQARHVILRVLLEGGGELVTVEKVEDDNPNILVKLDRNLIETRGKTAIRDFLTKLQVFRSSISSMTLLLYM